ncbi:MAG: purine-cytosine permease family protein [Steroidobacteraceae bacterium]
MSTAITTERHSIDFIPLSERYGSPRRLFTLWFSCNLSILGVAVGALSIASGLSFAWSGLALAVGNAIGTIFMAAHSAQGPQLGIPQMIQSRAQFGVIGAALPLIAVVATYLLYSAADGLIIEGSVKSLVAIDDKTALVLFALATLLIAYVGYELIHRIGAALTVISSGLFIVAAALIVARHPSAAAATLRLGRFNGAAFTLTMTLAAAWSLSYGPFVADYSRYLPANTLPSKTFWYTALGCFLGSTLIMAFGAYLAAADPAAVADLGSSVAALFGPVRQLAQWLIVVGVVYGNVMNLYSAYMSTCTIMSGFERMAKVGLHVKLAIMAVLMAISTSISMIAQDRFQTYFADILSAMIYLLVPWSAINLADYYVVRKGKYDIGAMFDTTGVYGAYRWRTISVFLLGILVQEPFMSFTFYKGAFAERIGADIAWLPGIVLSATLYVLIERQHARSEQRVGSGVAP